MLRFFEPKFMFILESLEETGVWAGQRSWIAWLILPVSLWKSTALFQCRQDRCFVELLCRSAVMEDSPEIKMIFVHDSSSGACTAVSWDECWSFLPASKNGVRPFPFLITSTEIELAWVSMESRAGSGSDSARGPDADQHLCCLGLAWAEARYHVSKYIFTALHTYPCTEHSPHMHAHLSLYFTHVNFLFSEEDILTGNNVWKQMGWEPLMSKWLLLVSATRVVIS